MKPHAETLRESTGESVANNRRNKRHVLQFLFFLSRCSKERFKCHRTRIFAVIQEGRHRKNGNLCTPPPSMSPGKSDKLFSKDQAPKTIWGHH